MTANGSATTTSSTPLSSTPTGATFYSSNPEGAHRLSESDVRFHKKIKKRKK